MDNYKLIHAITPEYDPEFKIRLLAEIEDILSTLPALDDLRPESIEALSWFGRAQMQLNDGTRLTA